ARGPGRTDAARRDQLGALCRAVLLQRRRGDVQPREPELKSQPGKAAGTALLSLIPPRKRGSRASDGAAALDPRFRGGINIQREPDPGPKKATAAGLHRRPCASLDRAGRYIDRRSVDKLAAICAKTPCRSDGFGASKKYCPFWSGGLAML